jgi:hypothetical protein
MKVSYEKGKLMRTNSAGQCELRAMTRTKFYCLDAEVELQFNQDRRGHVVGVTAQYPDHTDEYRKAK